MSPRLVLVGPMGSGKSTLGRELASRLNLPFADSDEVIVARLGMSIPEIFARFGEETFRSVEAVTVADLLAQHDGILSLGGGAVLNAKTRQLLRGERVVRLTVSPEAVAQRLAGEERPLLAGDALANWRKITDLREPLWREVAAQSVETGERSVANCVSELIRLLHPALPQEAELIGARDYAVAIGHGLDEYLCQAIPAGVRQILFVYQETTAKRAGEICQKLRDSGYLVTPAPVPDAEACKDVPGIAQLWESLGAAGFTRSDLVIGYGGGTVTDLAGFAAATWNRGVALMQVPTTVAGMVDAAIGGKTGINTAHGKNLVGAFHPPVAVVSDLSALETLPEREIAAGMAETLKCGFIADLRILDIPAADLRDIRSPEFARALGYAVRVKADVVSQDLREAGLREILNYGHTFGHAIELCEDYSWRHGEAVAVGMVFAAELARLSGRLDDAAVARHREVLRQMSLPTGYRGDWQRLRAAMGRDKKARGNTLRFVVLDAIAKPSRLVGPDEATLHAAYLALAGD
ncbi:3-dehydroquinate synthase [Dermabacteraceae bacterium P13103]